MSEIWKDIEGYEGLYQVSNFGRIKSLKRVVISKKGQKFEVEEKILKQVGRSRNKKYMAVHLSKNSVQYKASIHRLVANAFIPNPENLPFINHKDENPGNNSVENLEWCTLQYNNSYGSTRKRQSLSMLNNKSLSKKVNQYDLYGNYIATYPSTMEATRHTGIKHISCVCNGKRNKAGGYVWKYS